MEITGDHRFQAPKDVVWHALLDPAMLQAAIPGCERFQEVAPNTYDLTVSVGIGAIKGRYNGNVAVKVVEEGTSYRLVVSGSGKPGSVQGEALMTVTAEGEDTLVTYRSEVRAQGAIARLGSRVLAGSAKLMIGQFFKGMEKQIGQRTV